MRFPDLPRGRSLGVGLDLPWAGPLGFSAEPEPGHGEGPTPRTRAFLRGQARAFSHLFVSFQPRDRSVPSIQGYREAWDRLFEDVAHDARALHHTSLSLGTLVPYDRRAMLELTVFAFLPLSVARRAASMQ